MLRLLADSQAHVRRAQPLNLATVTIIFPLHSSSGDIVLANCEARKRIAIRMSSATATFISRERRVAHLDFGRCRVSAVAGRQPKGCGQAIGNIR
jgi:hypothetical protein